MPDISLIEPEPVNRVELVYFLSILISDNVAITKPIRVSARCSLNCSRKSGFRNKKETTMKYAPPTKQAKPKRLKRVVSVFGTRISNKAPTTLRQIPRMERKFNTSWFGFMTSLFSCSSRTPSFVTLQVNGFILIPPLAGEGHA